MTEFQAWPKIPRLNRGCVVTEKIDGTNAAVVIERVEPSRPKHAFELIRILLDSNELFAVFAQSRKRLLQTNEDGGKGSDNFAFAAWVKENALELAAVLGEGRHFGEWWGSGIQRAYGLADGERRFSLFNASRWLDQRGHGLGDNLCPSCCSVVPVLGSGTNLNAVAKDAVMLLDDEGSRAAPGFDNPEGIVVYHTAARQSFKVTLEGDESPKGIYKGMHSDTAGNK